MGKILTRTPRIAGRQAHMMPTVISMVDQTDTLYSSHVLFIDFPKSTKDRKRIMLTTVTLQRISILELKQQERQLTRYQH